MKILKLKLRGAIGIRKGLGVEEVEIDFSDFQSGLIALTGRNGSGKTTIMENLHPYRQMVSRDGSLQSHFYLKDSFRILDFEFNNRIYRAQIYIDALTGGSEAYLFNYPNGFDSAAKSLNDGKLTTYDKAIEDLLGSPQLFFNSVFSGQKSKGIAELSAGDRRKLFYELLNLNSYEVYLENAKNHLKEKENSLAKIEGEISALQQDQTSVDVLEEQRKEKLEYQAQLVGEISEIETSIEGASEVIRETEVKIQIANQKVIANEQIQKEIKEIESHILKTTKENNDKILRYQNDIADQNKLIERSKKLADPEYKKKIEASVKQIADNESELKKLKEQESKLVQEYSTFQKDYSVMLKGIGTIEKSLNDLEIKKSLAKHKVESLQTEIDNYQKNISLIDKVPCEEVVGKGCQFLTNAYNAKELFNQAEIELIDNEAELKSVEAEYGSTSKTLEEQKKAADDYHQKNEDDYNRAIVPIKVKMSSTEKTLAELKKYDYAKLLDEQKEAENQIKLCEQSISGHEKLIAETKISFDQSLTQLKKQVEELNKKYDAKVSDRIEEMNLNLATAKQKLTGLNQQLQSSKARIDEAKQDVAKLEQFIDTMTKNEERIEKLKDSKIEIESEIKDWTFLCKAFDKTGIPVLKLENSGIEITSVANELLSIFENKFRIIFETTKLKADKKSYKESFDINIVEEDGVCEISNKSGGQQVWLETAIQLAISLVVRNQGRNIQTAFLDEKDGALDLENAYSYIEMLRKAHQMSGVHNTFIITHRPELLDFIPQQVKLTDGVLEVVS